MLLKDLAESLLDANIIGDDNVEIYDMAYDSRKIDVDKKGVLFFCLTGIHEDGHGYAVSAVEQGAVVIVAERALALPSAITQVIVPDSREAMARMAAHFYGYPANKLTMIGVTGTNGKTSITYMVKAIAEAFGKRVGLLGTVQNMIGDKVFDTHMTTPDSIELQDLLAKMVAEGMQWVVMEVSAHALDLKKLIGMQYSAAVFTNLTQDHLDYFGSMEKYKEAKKKLFQSNICNIAVINADDPYGEKMVENSDVRVVFYSALKKTDVCAKDIEMSERGSHFKMLFGKDEIELQINIPGLFSVYNATAAAAVCYALGTPLSVIRYGLEHMKGVTGRFEVVDTPNDDFTVIVDYAHTPDGMKNVLETARCFAKGKIIAVFGCGGDRDQAKRPIMGKLGGELADYCVLTSDNPRTEESHAIIRMIEAGIKTTTCPYVCIENRHDAITHALQNAKADDVVLILGKGHENYQEINGVKYHFDDREIVAKVLDLS